MAVTEKTKYQSASNKQAEQDYRDLMNFSNEIERIRSIKCILQKHIGKSCFSFQSPNGCV